MTERKLSPLDRGVVAVDRMLRTLQRGVESARRPSPAPPQSEDCLKDDERRHALGLMRVNHTGEVMAQALYQGQALTARLEGVREQMHHAADEEVDHLVWCEERLAELGGKPSITNPLWYGLSLGMGAVAGWVSDEVSLGFVAAIEDQVCEHLQGHLDKLPERDEKSRAIVTQMLEDEARHGGTARAAGGVEFPKPVKKGLTLLSRVMTNISYRF